MGRGGGATHTESCDSAPSPTGRSQPLSAAWVGSPELQRLVSFEGLRSVKQLLKPQWTHSVFAMETEVSLNDQPHDMARDSPASGVRGWVGFGSRCQWGHTASIQGTVSGHSWPSGWVGSLLVPGSPAHPEGLEYPVHHVSESAAS